MLSFDAISEVPSGDNGVASVSLTPLLADQFAREVLSNASGTVYADQLDREIMGTGAARIYTDQLDREALGTGTATIYTDMFVREILLVPHTGIFSSTLVREVLTNGPNYFYDTYADGGANPADGFQVGNIYGYTLTEAANAQDRLTRVPGKALKAVYQPVPLSMTDWYPWGQLMARAINRSQAGGQNTGFLNITLNANSSTTIIIDPRIGALSHIELQPTTQSAANETWWIDPFGDGTATINHTNSAITDRTYRVIIFA